jgi:hypothetical protein
LASLTRGIVGFARLTVEVEEVDVFTIVYTELNFDWQTNSRQNDQSE